MTIEQQLKELAELAAAELEAVLDLKKIAAGLLVVEENIYELLRHRPPRQTGFRITQLHPNSTGVTFMPIVGIVVGATGTFTETPTPAGAVIPAGTVPQWSTSDTTNTTLTPSVDGAGVAVAVAATAPVGGSFTLTVANQDGSFPTGVSVPFLAPAPPPQTGFEINQVS